MTIYWRVCAHTVRHYSAALYRSIYCKREVQDLTEIKSEDIKNGTSISQEICSLTDNLTFPILSLFYIESNDTCNMLLSHDHFFQ